MQGKGRMHHDQGKPAHHFTAHCLNLYRGKHDENAFFRLSDDGSFPLCIRPIAGLLEDGQPPQLGVDDLDQGHRGLEKTRLPSGRAIPGAGLGILRKAWVGGDFHFAGVGCANEFIEEVRGVLPIMDTDSIGGLAIEYLWNFTPPNP
ncbi:MAG: hypothetical protein V3R60_04010 [Acidobacteriota bacterium]